MQSRGNGIRDRVLLIAVAFQGDTRQRKRLVESEERVAVRVHHAWRTVIRTVIINLHAPIARENRSGCTLV